MGDVYHPRYGRGRGYCRSRTGDAPGRAVETGTVEQIFHAPAHPIHQSAAGGGSASGGAMNGSDLRALRFPLIS